MTQLPSALLSPSRDPHNNGPRALIAWAVILGAATFMFVMTWRSYHRAGANTGDSADIRDMQVLIVARYAVGARGLLSALGQNTPEATTQLAQQLDGVATTPMEKLRVAITFGEMTDGGAALKRLDAVDPKNDAELIQDIHALREIYAGSFDSLSVETKQRLIARHGWFGNLALAYNQPAENVQRQQALGAAKRTFIVFIVAIVAFLALLLVGVGLLILAIVMLSNGKLGRAYQPAVPGQPFLEGFAIYIGGFVVIWLIFRVIAPALAQHKMAYYAALLLPPAAGIIWPLFRGIGLSAWQQAIGWHTGRGAFREIALGLVGYVAGLPIMVAAFTFVMVLSKHAGTNPTHPIIHELTGHGWELASIFILAAVYAPIAEETMFRGALFHALRVRHGWLLSACLTAFLFAAIHPQGWTVIPGLFAIAMIFAAIREWRGTILSSAAAHALNNGTVLLFVVLLLR